jgi:hypothetical protein
MTTLDHDAKSGFCGVLHRNDVPRCGGDETGLPC